MAVNNDPTVAAFLRTAAKDPDNKPGREIPHEVLVHFAPQLGSATAAFEPADHYMFAYQPAANGPYITSAPEKGDHGLWPAHPGYRSVFVIYGPDVEAGSDPETELTSRATAIATLHVVLMYLTCVLTLFLLSPAAGGQVRYTRRCAELSR